MTLGTRVWEETIQVAVLQGVVLWGISIPPIINSPCLTAHDIANTSPGKIWGLTVADYYLGLLQMLRFPGRPVAYGCLRTPPH